MTHSQSADERIATYLYAYTDAMLDDDIDERTLARQYQVAGREADDLTALLHRLDTALVEVGPSRQFKRSLRAELMGETAPSPFGRLRNLPPRLRFAAGVALLAAMALIGRRRLFGEITRLMGPFGEGATAPENGHSEATASTG